MKKKMTLALAASMLILTMAAAPHRALAASENYLTLDGGGGSDSGSHTTQPEVTWWNSLLWMLGV
jgi:Spy/CpxP family protein refolding chaperone